MEFTFIQLNNWRAYERVHRGGRWNMFDPQAQAATKLTSEDYVFVMNNFEALREAVQKDNAK